MRVRASYQFYLQLSAAVVLGLAALVGWPSNGRANSTEVLASGIQFLPESFNSTDQPRVSLVVKDNNLFFTDSSDSPVKKLSINDGAISPLALKMGVPENITIHGQDIFWIDGERLNKTSLDGSITTVLATGERDPAAGASTDIVVDETSVYWVNTVKSLSCSPSCTWIIQKVPIAGGVPTTLVSTGRQVVALASDATHIYWEENSHEPVTPDCLCGSTIKKVPISGGVPTVLVDGLLNGLVPPPSPSFIPASWFTTGGIAVDGSEIFFGSTGFHSYQVMNLSTSGGPVTILGSAVTSRDFALNSILHISVDGTNVHWIDSGNNTLNAVPVNGGSITTLVGDLSSPSDLVVTSEGLFWTEAGTVSGCCLQPETGRIRHVPLTGGVPTIVVDSLDAPGALALDSSSLYWTELWRIAKAPVSGEGPIITMASGVGSDLAHIAVDEVDVYILDGTIIKKVPINGGVVEKLTAQGGIGDFSIRVQDIAADGTNVYWTIKDVGPTGPVVKKIAIDGGPIVTLSNEGEFVSPQDCVWRIAVDNTNVYWTSGSSSHPVGCAIKKVPIDGGVTTTLVDVPFDNLLVGLGGIIPALDLAVDGQDIFFSQFSLNSSLKKVAVDGGTISTVTTLVGGIPITIDDLSVYVVDTDPTADGIWKVSKQGGTPTLLASGPLESDPSLAVDGFAVNQSRMYWTEAVGGTIKTAAVALPARLSIGASSLPEGEVGVVYNADLQVSGGVAPYPVSVTKGSLPAGLSFGSPVITGTPTKAQTSSFTVKVTDSAGTSVTGTFKIKILGALSISTKSLKAGTHGKSYTGALKAKGGQTPYSWSLLSGTLPTGFTLNSSTGAITGVTTQVGTFNPTFKVIDSLGGHAQKNFTLTIK